MTCAYTVSMLQSMKKKMGRPPKEPQDRHSKPVTLRMIPGEHKELLADAKRAGLSISAYVLACWRKVRG